MMDIEEMKVEYRLAKDQKEQIRLIADQLLMKPWEIAAMLKNAGEDVDIRWFPKPTKKQKAADLRRENEQLKATLDRIAEILFPMLPRPGEKE